MLQKSHLSNEILFLFPPFSSRKNPYLSIPVLSKYLKDKGVKVNAEDIGLKFWSNFINKKNLMEAYNFIEDRFLYLNEKQSLITSEMVEYIKISKLLETLPYYDIIDVSTLPDDFALKLLMSKYFPYFFNEKPFIALFSPFNAYSSEDILKSIEYDFFYSSLVENIIKEIFNSKNPLIVAISVIFSTQILPAFYIASLVKKYSPHSHVTLGGPIITIHFRELKNKKIFSIVDSLILDEGEIPLEKMYYELQKKNADLKKIPNLIWFNGKKIVKNSVAPPITLDKLSCPDYGVMPLDNYQENRDNISYLFRLSRGCYWQQCSFCRTDISFCKNYSQPDYSSVYDALVELVETYKAKKIIFSDESAHPKLLEYLSKKIIKDKLDISWFTHTRFHPSLTKDKFKLFKMANCQYLTLGLESYNNRILKLMKKGIDIDLINKVINENNGILPLKVYMMVGFPTETIQEAKESYKHVKNFIINKKLVDMHYSLFQLNFGSDMWNNPEKYGIKNIIISKEFDLFPNNYNIECEGMSRAEANELYNQFMNYSSKPRNTKQLIVKNKTVNINFDLKKIVSLINKHFISYDYSSNYMEKLINLEVSRN